MVLVDACWLGVKPAVGARKRRRIFTSAPEDRHAPVGPSPALTGLLLFAIDFEDDPVSMAAVMRALFCVVNERRQQMAGLPQAHPRVLPERARSEERRVGKEGR